MTREEHQKIIDLFRSQYPALDQFFKEEHRSRLVTDLSGFIGFAYSVPQYTIPDEEKPE